MGYFNENSLGEITSVTTNTMENLGNVATRVVMLTTQGLLNTGIILLMLICFDWRIGAIGAAGTVLFLFLNSRMQRAGKSISARKVESDAQVVSETMEYIQGISEVKSYNMTGEKTEKLRGLFFRDLFSRSNAGDSCTDHGRGVWHAPDGFHRAAELFLKPLMGLARSNGYHQGIRLDNFPDFMDDFRVELGLHCQNKNIGEGSDLRVV